jgi:putative peptidoglycan lipid II flippase
MSGQLDGRRPGMGPIEGDLRIPAKNRQPRTASATGADTPGRPQSDADRAELVRAATGRTVSVAAWTLVSRATGLLRVLVVAAVLGPTFFGNLYQATNLLPNIAYEFLAGSLFASLLVPAMVRHVDKGDRSAVERLAGGFLGVALLCLLLLAATAVLAGPLLVNLLTLGVADEQVVANQQRVGWLLLGFLMPQVILYGLVGTAVAVQNAHGSFAFPAAAPAIESVGIIATLGAYAHVFGTGTELADVGSSHLLLLGAGTTGAVGLHAAIQWGGARRVGVTLRPRAGWRDPEVRRVVRLAVPSLGYAGLNAGRLIALLTASASVPGGVVAFQLAMNFYNLPVALGGRPVAQAFLPQLARLHQARDDAQFRDVLVQGASLALFVTVPASIAYVLLARPLAEAASFGEMSAPYGVTLLAAALVGIGAAVVGETGFIIATQAFYARRNARSPLAVMAARTAISVGGLTAAMQFDGATMLLALGLTVAAADLTAATLLAVMLRRSLPPSPFRLAPAFGRAGVSATAMALPSLGAAGAVADAVPGDTGEILAVLTAAVVGAAVYMGVQRCLRSPELHSFRAVLGSPPRSDPIT